MHENDGEAGLTLVEIIISLFVIGLVLTTFFTVITGGLRSLSESRARQTTSQVATELIEELRRRAPSEIAMYSDPTVVDASEVDVTAVSDCTTSYDSDGDGTIDTLPGYDPDGPTGPMVCEAVVTNPLGAVRAADPWFDTADAIQVSTIATEARGVGVPDDTVRVTVVMTYAVAGANEEVRRSALFSEVSRG